MPAVSRQVEESIMFLFDNIIHPMVVDQMRKTSAVKAKATLAAEGKSTDNDAISALLFNNEVEKNLAESGFGTGGKYTRAMQAATAAVQGLMNGDLNAALAKGDNRKRRVCQY